MRMYTRDRTAIEAGVQSICFTPEGTMLLNTQIFKLVSPRHIALHPQQVCIRAHAQPVSDNVTILASAPTPTIKRSESGPWRQPRDACSSPFSLRSSV